MEKYNMALTYNQNVTDYKNTILWKDIGYKPSKRHPCPFLADLCITIFSKQRLFSGGTKPICSLFSVSGNSSAISGTAECS